MFILKIKKLIYSIVCYIKLKILFLNKIKLHINNLYSGKFSVYIGKDSQCNIGKRLCTDGPIYIKAKNASKITIGNRCYFNHNCSITSLKSISIGNDCMFGNNVTIVDHNHKIDNRAEKSEFSCEKVIIEDNVWVGANTTILKGTKIGKNSIIAAGAVVNSEIPSNEIWGGVPAKKIREVGNRNNK